MFRLLLVAGLLALSYFLLRSAIREYRSLKAPAQPPATTNDMVQDPLCKMFVPKASAISADIGGQTYLFCSRDCAETFQKQLTR